MSLYKQLTLALSLMFLLVFCGNFLISVRNIKNWLEGEAMIHAQDTATSLGLSLSPYLVDEQDPIIESMMQAMFDYGYYREISLYNVEDKPLIVLTDTSTIPDVPDWFIDYFPMQLATAHSEISSGWQITGKLAVTVNPGFAYRKLYQQLKSTLVYSAAAFAVVLCLLLLLIRIILQSLKRLETMALTIAGGQFQTLDKLPKTTEIRHLAIAMNDMSTKLAAVVNKLQSELEETGTQLLRDDLTSLPKKAVFENRAKELLLEASESVLYFVRLDCLTSLAKQQDATKTDEFIGEFAAALNQFCLQLSDQSAQAYRFQGGEFAVLVQTVKQQDIERIALALSQALAEIGKRFELSDLGHIGVTPLNQVHQVSELINAATEAYEQARMIGQNSFYIKSDHIHSRDTAAWNKLVIDCIAQQRFQLTFPLSIKSMVDGRELMREVYVRPLDENGEEISVAAFIAYAEKNDRIVALEKAVTGQVLALLKKGEQGPIAVNLSLKTLGNAEFRQWFAQQMRNTALANGRLIISLTAYGAAKAPDICQEFIRFAHQSGAHVVIKRFDPHSMPVKACTNLQPDYIRLARSFSVDIAQEAEKQQFVRTLTEVSSLLNVAVLAESVSSDADYRMLQELGIKGASR
jgi:EAL domain-containing protein (putative c-di-GMP-specific phosphodiesterase class I)/GGDEF domain-containing protein